MRRRGGASSFHWYFPALAFQKASQAARSALATGSSSTRARASLPDLGTRQRSAGIFASNYARDDELEALRAPRPPGSLPPLPSREVAVRGTVRQGAPSATSETTNRNIARLEAATVPRASAVEAYRGEVAAVFDASAAVLERAVGSDV